MVSDFNFKRADVSDIDLLTDTRIEVLRAANQLNDSIDMSLVKAQSREYYTDALSAGDHIAYLIFYQKKFIGAGGISFFRVMPTYHNPTDRKVYMGNAKEKTLNMEQITALTGTVLGRVFTKLCAAIDEQYDMEHLWNSGGKAWEYEYKYRRGGKTLCSLYIKEGCIGFLVIFGKAEREKFETCRLEFSTETQKLYDDATTYHDGKWMMFLPKDTDLLEDYIKLLKIKRKPNRK